MRVFSDGLAMVGMEEDRIAKRIYIREYAGSRSMGNPRKRWINTIKDCLRKRDLGVR